MWPRVFLRGHGPLMELWEGHRGSGWTTTPVIWTANLHTMEVWQEMDNQVPWSPIFHVKRGQPLVMSHSEENQAALPEPGVNYWRDQTAAPWSSRAATADICGLLTTNSALQPRPDPPLRWGVTWVTQPEAVVSDPLSSGRLAPRSRAVLC